MIQSIIHWSINNRVLVMLSAVILVLLGAYSVKHMPVDAIPDLSEVQVIIKTSYPGQAPQVVEDQVTYPLTTAMLSVPGAKTVRGFSFFGDSYVYVIFADDTDMYWARSRVLEYLSQAATALPATAQSEIGPDATGVGWVYVYALTDPTGQHDLSELRSIQDWFLQYELQTVPGVSEVATVGGMVKQYQVQIDPLKLHTFGIPLAHVKTALQRGNQEVGASVIEMAEAEYMIRTSGYIQSVVDIEETPIGMAHPTQGRPLFVRDVATVTLGPQMRRGVAELNGPGEVVGGIVVMRFGENAQAVITAVKDKLAQLTMSLPEGVEVVAVYDRSDLISDSVANLTEKLIAEFVIVAIICIIFLFHVRSALVAIISLPIGILVAFAVMYLQGINANIMSLGGVAIAIGAMIDGAIVLVENMHKHIEKTPLTKTNHWQIVIQSASEVGPALFFSLLIITVSFVPVFVLEAQEGKMFAPLAFTKTYAMAAAALLAITLVPVLMGYFVRGKIYSERRNPINRALLAVYRPILTWVLTFPRLVCVGALCILVIGIWPVSKISSEFMPDLDEGDLMYMPTTYAAVSIGEARQILQQTNKLIKTLPEVATVFGKVGRAETATDPAPLTMLETFIQLKPKAQWRPGMTTADLIRELDSLIDFPGLTNAWVMPIKTRIDMLATGIKTPLGIKIGGPDLTVIEDLGQSIERIFQDLPGTASVYAERVASGRYLNIDINRVAAAQYGLSIADIQTVIASAVGGIKIGTSVEGLERYPIQLRYPQSYRDGPEQLARLPMTTSTGLTLQLGDVAEIRLSDGPSGIKSENARPNGWVYIDTVDVPISEYVEQAKQAIATQLTIPPGYALTWNGQYEYMERAQAKLAYVVPLTLGIIVILLYLSFGSVGQVVIIMGTLPFALIGGIWLLYTLDFQFSVAVGVGFIALAGVAVEIGIIMLTYFDTQCKALKEVRKNGKKLPENALQLAIMEAAQQRIRPVMMTSASIIFGLLPVLYTSGTGSEIMSRIAVPMIGGMVSALVLSLVVLPSIYYLWRKSEF